MSFGVNIWYFLLFQNILCDVNNAANLKIAGIFENIQLHETAFRYSNIIYKKYEKTHKDADVSHIIEKTIIGDEPFTAYKGTCSFLKDKIVGIFGPQSTLNLDIVQSITETKDIPHILTRWVNPSQKGSQTINFFPSSDRLADGFLDIVKALEWKSFTILYTDAENLLKINEFIRKAKDDNIIVYLENVNPLNNGIYRQSLHSARRSGQKNFVLDCPIRDFKNKLLPQLQQVGMLTAEYNYFLTNMDSHTEDLTPFQHSGAVIIGVHLLNDKDEIAKKASEKFCHFYNLTFGQGCEKPTLDIETALILDSVSVVLQKLNALNVTQGQYLDCDTDEAWKQGLSIINDLKTGTYEGITGQIEFDDRDGSRKTFQLTIYQIGEEFIKIGTWNTAHGLSKDIELPFTKESDDDDDDELKNKKLMVMIALTEPYARLKESAFHLKGNDKYEGFAIDLIEEMARLEGFSYTLVVREDHKHGYFDPRIGKWNGMIGDIIEGKADLAISDLTINKERIEPVEFTHPFMTVGIGILFRKPAVVPPGFFHFAQPFSLVFWQFLGFSYLIMVVSLFLIGRLSPEEWQRPHTCKSDKNYLINELTFLNSFWFVAAGLFRQPTNVKINSIAAKIIAGAWYIYCFILFAMYISYSFAQTATEEAEELFDDVEGLLQIAESKGIKFGALSNGATEQFFKNSKSEVYQEVATYMKEHPDQMVDNTLDGIQRALNGDYAFFMESATIEYTTRRQCNMTSYGGLLDSKGFGIAVRKGTPYLGILNKAITKLQASGELLRLKQIWWEERYAGDICITEDASVIEDKTAFHIEGLLFITFLGTGVALVLSIFEFTIYVFRLSKRIKSPFGKTFGEEFKKCFGKNHTVQNVEEISLTKPENGNSSNKENA